MVTAAMMRLTAEFERALEAMPVGIVAVDGDGCVVFANRQVETITGYSSLELAGLPVEVLVPDRQRETHGLQRSDYWLARTPPRPMGLGLDIRLRRKDGSELRADIALSPVDTATGRVVIAAVRAIGEQPSTAIAENRDQIERDLHERALQTLFGVSLNLQAAAAATTDPALSERLAGAVTHIDEVLRELRNYLFGLLPGILAERAAWEAAEGSKAD